VRSLSFHSEPASEDHDEAQRARMYPAMCLIYRVFNERISQRLFRQAMFERKYGSILMQASRAQYRAAGLSREGVERMWD
jgi:hypothetical protein